MSVVVHTTREREEGNRKNALLFDCITKECKAHSCDFIHNIAVLNAWSQESVTI